MCGASQAHYRNKIHILFRICSFDLLQILAVHDLCKSINISVYYDSSFMQCKVCDIIPFLKASVTPCYILISG